MSLQKMALINQLPKRSKRVLIQLQKAPVVLVAARAVEVAALLMSTLPHSLREWVTKKKQM